MRHTESGPPLRPMMTLAPGLRRRCLRMKLATRAVMSVEVLSYVGVCIVSVNVCVNVCIDVSVDVCRCECRCGCEEKGYMWWHVAFIWYKITHFSWNNRFGTTFFEKKPQIVWSVRQKVLPLHSQTKNNNGALDERLSQRSAKPCTPVRIGYAPLKKKDAATFG